MGDDLDGPHASDPRAEQSAGVDQGLAVEIRDPDVTEGGVRGQDDDDVGAANGVLVGREHPRIERVAPADEIDPEYGKLMRMAVEGGVEVIAFRADMSPREIELKERVPVEL